MIDRVKATLIPDLPHPFLMTTVASATEQAGASAFCGTCGSDLMDPRHRLSDMPTARVTASSMTREKGI